MLFLIALSCTSVNKSVSLPLALRFLRRLPLPRKLGLLERLFGRVLSKHGVVWVQTANRIRWKLDLADGCHRWLVYGYYEGGAGIKLARRMLKHGGVYVDSGANIGQWLVYISNLKQVQTLAFEPVASERSWLTSCIAEQGNWNVEIIANGLGDEFTSLPIQVHGARSTIQSDWYAKKGLDRELITMVSLEQALSERSIDRVRFWKLDVEGFEYEALVGAGKYIEQQKIDGIYFECHPDNFDRNIKLLSSCGYEIMSFSQGRLGPMSQISTTLSQDYFARPRTT